MTLDITHVFADPEWNREAVRAYLAAQSASDERYLQELKGRIAIRPAYQVIYDQTLASYQVHSYFCGRALLSTRADFLLALTELETSRIPHDEYFDPERFATSRLNVIRVLLRAASLPESKHL